MGKLKQGDFMNFDTIIDEALKNKEAMQGSFSGPIKRHASKLRFKTIMMKGEAHLQLESFEGKKAFHENIAMSEAKARLSALMNEYKQLFITFGSESYQVFNNKGKFKLLKAKTERAAKAQSHNKKKNYILEEGERIDFLIYLKVMSEDGKVYKSYYDKFKQINKYLEIFDKALEKVDTSKKLRILDFGCGKAYLTFAVYYYLKNIRKLDFYIEGLDLKEDVVHDLNSIKDALHYEDIDFVCKDIKDYSKTDNIDIMLTLHACDIATDIAIKKAVDLNASLILSVPCCQKELFPKIKSNELEGILKHGIRKERVAAIVTDSLRSLYLEMHGYKSEIIEFIDMDHTPKNLMIRAFKDKANPLAKAQYDSIKKLFNLENIFIEG